MRELVDADSASEPIASTGGDACQQREIVSRDWDTADESVGPAARRIESLVGPMSVSKRVGYGEVEVWWECNTHHLGRTKAGT